MSKNSYNKFNNNDNSSKKNLELIKKENENFCDKIYEKAYQVFLNKILYEENSCLKNISPIKLTRSINIIK